MLLFRNQLLCVLILISTVSYGQKEYCISSSDNISIYFQEFGRGETVVLLSGGPGLNPLYMDSVWLNLSSDFRCIVLHQRGTGKSMVSELDSSTFTMQNYVSDLEALRIELGLKAMNIIGHSWGGMLGMEYTARYPEHVNKLILVGPGGPTDKLTKYCWNNMTMRLHPEDIEEINTLDSLKKSTLKGGWPGYFYDRTRALESKSNINFEMITRYASLSQYTVPNYFLLQDERVDLLRNYHNIVHIIQGRQDPMGESTVFEIKEIMPQAQIHFIEKCGHFPWLENEKQIKEFYQLLRNALK